MKDILTSRHVQCVTLDYEAAVWEAIKREFEDVQLHGCAFHWSQAVWRKAQQLGIQPEYEKGNSVHQFMRRIFSLQLVPAEHISPILDELEQRSPNDQISALLQYINNTWLQSSIWSVNTWSQYGRAIRTNNDLESWHNRLNRRAGKEALNFYILVQLLFKEARLIPVDIALMSAGNLKKQQKRWTRRVQGTLFETWAKYRGGEINASKLLRKLGKVYDPIRLTQNAVKAKEKKKAQ